MNSEAILQSDLLDILFENRNKDYGAYILRKFYPGRVKTSLCIMFGSIVLFSAFTFLPEHDRVNAPIVIDSVVVRNIELDKKEVKKPPAPKYQSANTSQRKFISGFVIKDKIDSTDILHAIDDIPIGTATFINTSIGGIVVAPVDEASGQVPEPVGSPEPANEPVYDPDVPASFPGGVKELRRFLQKNLASPRELEEGEIIEVRIKYVVGFDGNLQSFEVVKDGGELFDNEVVRVLKKMPKWIPGKKGSRNVPVYYTLPVKFVPLE